MTVYGCYLCEEKHGRLTTIHSGGAIYFDETPRVSRVGSYGCPQCARNCCGECGEEQEGICPCGGELVPDTMFHYDGDGRLPEEISCWPSVEERTESLRKYRKTHPMINAEYRHYEFLIRMCDLGREEDGTLPESPGFSMLKELLNQKYGVATGEVCTLFFSYAIPGNIDRMLELLDKRCFDALLEDLGQYPSDADEEGWKSREDWYRDPENRIRNFVPFRTPEEIVGKTRKILKILREGVSRSGRGHEKS